jgi:hexosaminidase
MIGYEPFQCVEEHARASVLGLQGQLWTEYQRTSHALEFMAFPRFCALAEVAWSALENRNWQDFLQRLDPHLRRLDVMEVACRSLSLADWLDNS